MDTANLSTSKTEINLTVWPYRYLIVALKDLAQ
jgi:hypothetical protein